MLHFLQRCIQRDSLEDRRVGGGRGGRHVVSAAGDGGEEDNLEGVGWRGCGCM